MDNGRRSKYFGGAEWKRDIPSMQYNVDVWTAQQTLRKQWKGRDWDVFELPFEKAPTLLQRVIPEIHTEAPVMSDPANGDFSNIRAKVFDREELQDVLYPDFETKPYPKIEKPKKDSKITLDSFFTLQ